MLRVNFIRSKFGCIRIVFVGLDPSCFGGSDPVFLEGLIRVTRSGSIVSSARICFRADGTVPVDVSLLRHQTHRGYEGLILPIRKEPITRRTDFM